MADFSIIAEGITKKYGDFTAVDGISFSVKKGEIYGFLGANGAGKTTTIKMLCGLLEPTSGDAEVAGYSVKKKPEEIKKRIGYMSQKFSLYNNLTVAENITFYAGIYGLDKKKIPVRLGEVVEKTGLSGFEDRVVKLIPSGIKQRISLACSMVHEPDVIFLDEPTAGVDPLLRRRFWGIIEELSGAGTTLFVTTHYMDEVEQCHRISLMHAAKIIKSGTVEEVRNTTFLVPVIEVRPVNLVEAYGFIREMGREAGSASVHGAVIHVVPPAAAEKPVERLRQALDAKSVKYLNIGSIQPSMEDVFVELVRRNENARD